MLFLCINNLAVCLQVESIPNYRPLHPASYDPNEVNPITLAHFLIGRTVTSLPNLNYVNIPDNNLSRF